MVLKWLGWQIWTLKISKGKIDKINSIKILKKNPGQLKSIIATKFTWKLHYIMAATPLKSYGYHSMVCNIEKTQGVLLWHSQYQVLSMAQVDRTVGSSKDQIVDAVSRQHGPPPMPLPTIYIFLGVCMCIPGSN